MKRLIFLNSGEVDSGARTLDGRTALHLAASNDHRQKKGVVELLLETGNFDLGNQDREGKTALDIARSHSEACRKQGMKWSFDCSQEIVKALVDARGSEG